MAGRRITTPQLVLAAITMILLLAAPARANHYDAYLAPLSACPYQTSTEFGESELRHGMRCMMNHTRAKLGCQVAHTHSQLEASADRKAYDIRTCSFSHYACGRTWSYWFGQSGYTCGTRGEILAWGSGSYGTVRGIMSAWLHSDSHRPLIFNGVYRSKGVGLDRVSPTGAHYWTTHFGAC